MDDAVSRTRRVHIVAIGGAAMSGIARFLKELGYKVSGSDVRPSSTIDALRAEGVTVHVGHDAAHVDPSIGAVIYSTAVAYDNVELAAARALGVECVHRSVAMGAIVGSVPKRAVISGTHGKTSTSSLVAEILRYSGLQPSWFIGGTAVGLGTNAHFDPAGDWIVVEGDESDRSFLAFDRTAALVTNIEADHLEHWDHDFDTLWRGFGEFAAGASGPVVVCGDDQHALRLLEVRHDAVTYGVAPSNDYQLLHYEPSTNGAVLTVRAANGEAAAVRTALRGPDMALNTVAAMTLAHRIGVSWSDTAVGAEGFRGVARRFEFKASYEGVDCFDDYAHTATEIATTIARAREGAWRRVIAVCQPHRYSRIAAHGHEYGDALRAADVVVVTALDPAFEPPIVGVDAHIVVDSVRAAAPDVPLEYIREWEDLADLPWRIGQPGDVIITLGCGTITDAHALWAAEAGRRT